MFIVNAAVGAVAGNVIGGLFGSGAGGGSGGSGQAAPVYQPTNQPGMDANYQWNNSQYNQLLQDQYKNVVPYNQNLFNQYQNSPYASQYQNGMNGVAGMYTNNANQAAAGANTAWGNAASANQWGQDIQGGMIANSPAVQHAFDNQMGMGIQSNQMYDALMGAQEAQQGNVAGSAQNLYSSGNALLNSGFDPQGAMYRQNVGDLVANTRAGEYARGIQMSPAGESVEADALGRFQNDWQNQQLARESQAASAASGAYQGAQGMNNSWANNLSGLVTNKNTNYSNMTDSASQMMANWGQAQAAINASNANANAKNYATATTLDNQSTQDATQAATLPYSTSQQIYGNNVQAMNNFSQGYSPLYSGFNQLQSNALGYMNYGQGAQNLGYNQNMQNAQYMNDMGRQIAGGGMFGSGGPSFGQSLWGWMGGWQPNTSAPNYSNNYQPEGGDLGQYL